MRKIFDKELEHLNNQFLKMGQQANLAISKSLKAFIDHDVDLATEIIVEDKKINNLEIAIEKECFNLIALQQPVAGDLRRIVSIMKATSDLERIGDHGVNIARSTIKVKGTERILEVEKMLEDMGKAVESMISQLLEAYVVSDSQSAKEISSMDENIDVFLKKIVKITTKHVTDNPTTVTGGMEYVMVAGYLERIGDYVTNVCERIIYTNTGQLVELN